MDSKKVNVFAFVMIIVMCAFSIFIGISNQGSDGINGRNGMSAYELAIKNKIISPEMSEVEYLNSLYGKDGSSVTLEDVYRAYLKEKNITSDDLTYTDFILSYYPDKIQPESETLSLIHNATQNALRSTVDICYSFYMETPIIFGYYEDANKQNFRLTTNANSYVSIGVSAGSGVIFSYEDTDSDGEDDTAYIVTNYHVVYCANYSSDDNYYVYCDEDTGEYFTATYNENIVKEGSERVPSIFGTMISTYNYISASDMVKAPLYTHFLDNYCIYLYGYQSEKYEITASFVGGSAENDIAVLKVTKDDVNSNNSLIFDDNFKTVDLGSSASLSEGETIVAVGNPLLVNTPTEYKSSEVAGKVKEIKDAYVDALCLTSTSGEVSNLSEYCTFQSLLNPTEGTNMRLIRVSAAINAGNSGGGLYSADGKLVGIVNGKIASESYDNVGYAIPIDVVKSIVNQVILQCDNKETVTRINAVTSNKLGIDVSNGSSHSYYDTSTLKWVLENDIVVDNAMSISSSSGLLIKDVISSITIDGVKYEVDHDYDVDDILLNVKTTDTSITLGVLRGSSDSQEAEINIVINITNDCFEEII